MTTSPQTKAKRRGSKFETDLVEYLKTHGFPNAERRHLEGKNDRGDVAGVPGWVLEAKAIKLHSLGTAMKEAEKEAENAGVTRFALVKKRPNKSTAEAYAVIPLYLLAELMLEG